MHKYLGMNMDYRKQGKVKIDMMDYLKKILDNLPEKYQGRAITPEEKHHFEVNNTTRKLSERTPRSSTPMCKNGFSCASGPGQIS